jgi:hypothetical protein
MPPPTRYHDQSKRFPHPTQALFFASKLLGTSGTEKITERAPKEIRAGTAGWSGKRLSFDGACGAQRQTTGTCSTHPAFYQHDQRQTTNDLQPAPNSQQPNIAPKQSTLKIRSEELTICQSKPLGT